MFVEILGAISQNWDFFFLASDLERFGLGGVRGFDLGFMMVCFGWIGGG